MFGLIRVNKRFLIKDGMLYRGCKKFFFVFFGQKTLLKRTSINNFFLNLWGSSMRDKEKNYFRNEKI